MVLSRCNNCKSVYFPPPIKCKNCCSKSFEHVIPSGRGKIYAFTKIGVTGAPGEYAEQVKLNGSYVVALIDLEEGPRIMGQLTDCTPDEVVIGQEVKLVFRIMYRQEGVIRYGFKFKPLVE